MPQRPVSVRGGTLPPGLPLIGVGEGQSDSGQAHWRFPEVSGAQGGLENADRPACVAVDWPLFLPLIQCVHSSPPRHLLPSVVSAALFRLDRLVVDISCSTLLPFTERVEGKGVESTLHIFTLSYYWSEWMSLTSPRRAGAVIGDDWLLELSVNAGA